MDNKYVQAAEVLKAAVDQCEELLGANDRMFLGVKTKISLISNQLVMVGGRSHSSLAAPSFKKTPITEFMGDPITRPEKVTVDQVNPEEQERQLFRDKIDRLANNLDTLTNEQIVESYQNEQSVVRGLAKISGIESYKDAEFNGTFIDLIRTTRAENAAKAEAEAEEQRKIEEAAKNEKTKKKS